MLILPAGKSSISCSFLQVPISKPYHSSQRPIYGPLPYLHPEISPKNTSVYIDITCFGR